MKLNYHRDDGSMAQLDIDNTSIEALAIAVVVASKIDILKVTAEMELKALLEDHLTVHIGDRIIGCIDYVPDGVDVSKLQQWYPVSAGGTNMTVVETGETPISKFLQQWRDLIIDGNDKSHEDIVVPEGSRCFKAGTVIPIGGVDISITPPRSVAHVYDQLSLANPHAGPSEIGIGPAFSDALNKRPSFDFQNDADEHVRKILLCYEGKSGAEWFEALREYAEKAGQDTIVAYIDSMPEYMQEAKKLEKGHVVVPDGEHITEQMVDASRGLHLYYMDNGSGVDNVKMRNHLRRYAPWSEKHWPQWFKDEDSHLTKAGRAVLAHTLTVAAYRDPDARVNYFEEAHQERQKVWDKPMHQRIKLTFKDPNDDTQSFFIKVPFISAHLVGDNEFLLRLNRTDFPKEHRKKFKSTALIMRMNLINEGKEVFFHPAEVNYKGIAAYDLIPTMTSRY